MTVPRSFFGAYNPSKGELASFAGGFLTAAMQGPLSIMQGLTKVVRFRELGIKTDETITADSLQEQILVRCGKYEQSKRKRLELASEHSFGVMLKVLTGKNVLEIAERLTENWNIHLLEEFSESTFWRTISLFSYEALQIKNVKKRVAEELRKGNGKFFVELGQQLDSRSKMRATPDFNRTIFTMAQFWVYPSYPLWMMNNEAGSRFVGYVLGTEVSVENYAQLIKRHRLIRFKTFPIRGINIHQNGKLMGFELSRWTARKV